MAKYSYEFKKKIVSEYLNNEGRLKFLIKKHGMKSEKNLSRWVKAYEKYGESGLVRSRKKEKYTFEFKLSVVESYLTTEASYQELALNVGMNNPPLITKWVNDYRISGSEALREKTRGRPAKKNKT